MFNAKIIATTSQDETETKKGLPFMGIHWLNKNVIEKQLPSQQFPGQSFAQRIVAHHQSKQEEKYEEQKASKTKGVLLPPMEYTFLPQTALGQQMAQKLGIGLEVVRGSVTTNNNVMERALGDFVEHPAVPQIQRQEYIIFISVQRQMRDASKKGKNSRAGKPSSSNKPKNRGTSKASSSSRNTKGKASTSKADKTSKANQPAKPSASSKNAKTSKAANKGAPSNPNSQHAISDLIAITSNNGWRMVVPYSSHKFPIRMMQLFGNPTSIKDQQVRHFTGHVMRSYFLYSQDEKRSRHELLQMAEILTAPLRGDLLLDKLPALGDPKNTQRPNLTMCLRQVKLHKTLKLPDVARLAVLFAHAFRREAPFKKGELTIADGFKFLEHIQPVSFYDREALNLALLKHLYLAVYENGPEDQFVISGKEKQAYSNSVLVRIRMGKTTLEINRSAETITMATIVRIIKHQKAFSACDFGTFCQLVQSMTFQYGNTGRAFKEESLLSTFNGEVHVNDNHYFHIDGIWYQINGDFLDLIDDSFREILKGHLVSAPKTQSNKSGDQPTGKKRGSLPTSIPATKKPRLTTTASTSHDIFSLPYEWTPAQILTKAAVAARLSQSQSQSQLPSQPTNPDDNMSETSSVVSDSQVSTMSSTSSGRKKGPKNQFIIKHLAAALDIKGKGAQKIPKAFIKRWLAAGFIEKRTKNSYKATETGAKQYTVPAKKKKGKDEHKFERSKAKEITEFLATMYKNEGSEKKRNDNEGIYNNKYLATQGFIVGDKKLPKGLELFDVLKITVDGDGKPLFIFYHNKIGFSQHVRDVVSQIVNAASAIVNSRASNNSAKGDNLLGLMYDSIINSPGAKQTLKANNINNKKAFINAIKNIPTENLVFVFGFMNSYAGRWILERELARKKRAKPLIESNIARFEIIRGQETLKKLGVGFKIVTIERNENATYYDSCTPPTIPTMNMSQLETHEADDVQTQTSLIGRAGANDCWMTPFVWGVVKSPYFQDLQALDPDTFCQTPRWIAVKADHPLYTDADITGIINILKNASVAVPLTDAQTLLLRQHLKNMGCVESMTNMIDPSEVIFELFPALFSNYAAINNETTTTCSAAAIQSQPQEIPEDDDASQALFASFQQGDNTFTESQLDNGELTKTETLIDLPRLRIYDDQEGNESFANWIDKWTELEDTDIADNAKCSLYYVEGDTVTSGDFPIEKTEESLTLENGRELWIDAQNHAFTLSNETFTLGIGPDQTDIQFRAEVVVEHYGNHYECYSRNGDTWEKYEFGHKKFDLTLRQLNQWMDAQRQNAHARYQILLVRVN